MGDIEEGKWIFPNGTYFHGKFLKNKPKGTGTWHFANGNIVKGEFNHQNKVDPETDAEIIAIDWITNPEIIDPTRFIDA